MKKTLLSIILVVALQSMEKLLLIVVAYLMVFLELRVVHLVEPVILALLDALRVVVPVVLVS